MAVENYPALSDFKPPLASSLFQLEGKTDVWISQVRRVKGQKISEIQKFTDL